MSMESLPKGHWMHAVAAKEKARIAKKKSSGVPATAPGPASVPMVGAGGVAPEKGC